MLNLPVKVCGTIAIRRGQIRQVCVMQILSWLRECFSRQSVRLCWNCCNRVVNLLRLTPHSRCHPRSSSRKEKEDERQFQGRRAVSLYLENQRRGRATVGKPFSSDRAYRRCRNSISGSYSRRMSEPGAPRGRPDALGHHVAMLHAPPALQGRLVRGPSPGGGRVAGRGLSDWRDNRGLDVSSSRLSRESHESQ